MVNPEHDEFNRRIKAMENEIENLKKKIDGLITKEQIEQLKKELARVELIFRVSAETGTKPKVALDQEEKLNGKVDLKLPEKKHNRYTLGGNQ